MKKLLLQGVFLFCCLFAFSETIYSQVDLYLDTLNVYVSKYGKIQIYSMPDTIQQVARISVLVGTGQTTVMDEREDIDYLDITTQVTPTISDYEIYGSYNNNYSGKPPNVLIKQNIYCWKNQNSFIVKFTIVNLETAAITARFGLELIPEVSGEYAGTDTVTYNPRTKLLTDRKKEAVGFQFLSGEISSLNTFMYYTDYGNDSTFWSWLTSGKTDTLFIIDPNTPSVDDPVIIPSFSPKTIAAGDSAKYYISVGYGKDKNVLAYNMQLAQQKYNNITSVKTFSNEFPSNYSIAQNYPNPFNPETKISFNLPKAGFVTLKVYNVLGEEVSTLVNEEKTAGKYVVDFNSHGLTSGIYFYTIQSGSFHATKKMTLIK